MINKQKLSKINEIMTNKQIHFSNNSIDINLSFNNVNINLLFNISGL